MSKKTGNNCNGLLCPRCKLYYYTAPNNCFDYVSGFGKLKREEIEMDFPTFIKILIDANVPKEKKLELQSYHPQFIGALEKGEEK